MGRSGLLPASLSEVSFFSLTCAVFTILRSLGMLVSFLFQGSGVVV